MMKHLLLLATFTGIVTGYCGPKAERNFEVLLRPEPRVEIELGDTISLVCAAHGHNMMDPLVYWVKGIGPDLNEEGKRMGPTAVGKSTFYIEKAEKEDIDNYKCVIEDCCSGNKEEITVEILVPEETCQDVYGVGHVVFGATWVFRNWTAAIADCESKGLELALPKNEEENAQLQRDLQASFETHPNAAKFAHENWCWIAASDEETEDTWLAVKDNEPLTYFNWDKKQPDNKDLPLLQKGKKQNIVGNSNLARTQNVAGIHRGTGLWDDSFVHYKRPYACLCPTD